MRVSVFGKGVLLERKTKRPILNRHPKTLVKFISKRPSNGLANLQAALLTLFARATSSGITSLRIIRLVTAVRIFHG
jgi:hypothetical protein